MNGRSEHKVPGGKLVRADVRYEDTIQDVELHGDFFVYPETALDDVEKAFVGKSPDADEDELAQAVADNVPITAKLIGFSPEDAATAVKKAIDGGDTDE